MSKTYVNKLQYLGYDTIYESHGDINISLDSHACFGSVLNIGRKLQKEHYEIYFIRSIENALQKNHSHLCLMNKPQLTRHIWLVRRLFPFKYVVEDCEYRNYPAFKVTIDIDLPRFYHKYLLTWIRYAYEFPYNLIMEEALRMKHQYLPKENIPNLFVLCANSIQHYCPSGYSEGHGISRLGSYFLKEKELKQRIVEKSTSTYPNVNDLYKNNYQLKLRSIYNGSDNYKYLDYWSDPDAFQERAKVYLENYKVIKG